jgi:uncharacterized protein (UPF0548 family)
VLYLRRPAREEIRRVLREQARRPFTYAEVGASRYEAPAGYPINHHRACLGAGRATYLRARAALDAWRMYALPWTTLCWPAAPIEAGVVVAVLVRHPGFWTLNPCRIVYTLDELGPVERHGFAFGTLPAHSERGEERFTVELRPDGTVHFEIYTFAAAHHPLARMAPFVVRALQQRFGREACEAMRAAVRHPLGSPAAMPCRSAGAEPGARPIDRGEGSR